MKDTLAPSIATPVECPRTLTDRLPVNDMIDQANAMAPDSPSTSIEGHIDSYEGGYLRGWVCDRDAMERRLRISVRCGSSTIGVGVADLERPDLRNANIGDGRYGFAIALSDDMRAMAGEALSLLTEEGEAIPANHFEAPDAGLTAWADVFVIPGGSIRASMSIAGLPDGEYDVFLHCAGKVIAPGHATFQGGVATSSFGVPLEFMDGEERSYTLSMRDRAYPIARAELIVPPFQLPWEHVERGRHDRGMAALSGMAGRRYESLRAQIDVIAGGTGALDLEALSVAHSQLIEGWENRTRFPPLKLPAHEAPVVSVIIPVHNKLELTYHACASIILAFNQASYEVIVVDDASTDQTTEIESIIEGLKVVRNEDNLGFLLSVNKAAESATGDYLIILNNDTEVTSGWIDELIAPFDNSNVGLTGSKLLNLDGSIQEAGGIVWENGQPWNVGRDANPYSPEYNYLRDVDYVSGAAMCIDHDLWRELGGFSEELAPAYYEDTDLAFKVREAGRRTVYVPRSEVVHFEGKSHGTDVTKGVKRYQVVNERKFREKWFDAYRGNGRVGVDLHMEKDRHIDHRVLVFDYCTPDANRDAGGYAAMEEMKLFQSLGFKVTFVPLNMAHMGKLTWSMQSMGIEVLHAPYYQSPAEVIERRGHEFDAVYITRYEVAESVLEYVRIRMDAKVIFNNADLHFLRMLRSHSISGQPPLDEVLSVRDRELSVMRGVDAIVSYNEIEHVIILSHNLRDDNVFRCPWVVGERPKGPDFAKRHGIAFLGGYRHPPNVEGVNHFVENVWPTLLERDPELVLYLYGSNAPESIRALASDNIVVVGYVESLDEVFHKHRVFVAPLLSGAGLKGKVVEAMAYGLPTVLTKIAAEATGLTDGVTACVADTTEEWVDGILRYHEDEEVWSRTRSAVLDLTAKRFSPEAGRRQWREVMAHVGIFTKDAEAEG